MRIENHFDIPLTPAAAWAVLMDVAATAACFPGASVIEQIDAERYKGRVTVKLGPLTMVFAGTLCIEQRDDAAFSAAIKAQWSEVKGRGNANSVTQFALQAANGGTRVNLHSDLQLAGQVAQYGRGAGMISAISAQLVADFAQTLRARIEAAESGATLQPNPATPISALGLAAKVLVKPFKR